ncbi:helix-turn-helix transcriptional regulator [Burkholderia plantarii]|uniref:helix-turn-helix transcriptional regulator n=1 Tax=Burkholderia plantarii TaxID=41899 RepID=UPI0018DD15A3|nr:AraC family transcriptional regulator [Burkholderia plantarii]MBI0331728.1 AraC family transcriptional regulator [Burkholderia plantarii]
MQLDISLESAIRAQNGGLFVSRNADWVHPQRRLESYELIFVRQGVLYLREEDIEFAVQPGEALLLWPHRNHGGTQAGGRGLKFYWVHFTLANGVEESAAAKLRVLQHTRVARLDQMSALFRQLLNDQELFGTRSATLAPIITLLLCELARSDSPAAQTNGVASALAAKADIVIQSKFASDISASTIADELHCNPDYLGRVFRHAYGKTLTDALHERRVRHAATLLVETGKSLGEIGQLCGFADPAYFRRIFSRYQEMTPSAWRALHTRMHVNHV